MGSLKSIHAKVTKEQFWEAYLKDLPGGGLFVPANELYGLGEVLQLHLDLEGLRDQVLFMGSVAWHRRPRAWSSLLPSGIGFQFDVAEESKRDFLLKFVSGKVVDRRRSGPRRDTEHYSKIKIHGTWVPAKAINLSVGGVLLVTDEKIERGAMLHCMVYVDDTSAPIECHVQVERVDREDKLYVAGARLLRIPPGFRDVFPSPTMGLAIPETRAQQILKRSTLSPFSSRPGATIPFIKK